MVHSKKKKLCPASLLPHCKSEIVQLEREQWTWRPPGQPAQGDEAGGAEG